MILNIGFRACNILPVQIHDHARRTEAALAAIVLSNTLLYGMKSGPIVANTLCCGDLPAITTKHWVDALEVEQKILEPIANIYISNLVEEREAAS